jgi:hypothetical protein
MSDNERLVKKELPKMRNKFENFIKKNKKRRNFDGFKSSHYFTNFAVFLVIAEKRNSNK